MPHSLNNTAASSRAQRGRHAVVAEKTASSVPSVRRAPLISALVCAVLMAVWVAWGGWQRRWMSDDGLIVLRTVRNLLAGNGPVFNAGERVEANTSVLWQYLIYLGAVITPAKLEIIALWLSLALSVLAAIIATLGTGHLYRRSGLILFPFGLVLYFALPPARDFITSGLEWGLAIAYLAALWGFLALWIKPVSSRWLSPRVTLSLLAFWAGLSWLVRPELALYGIAVILMLMAVHHTWRALIRILLFALPVPLAYEIFRMGYYGLLVPHTAVAKSAAEAEWGKGWTYLTDFTTSYYYWWVLVVGVIVVVAAVRFGRRAWVREENAAAPSDHLSDAVHAHAQARDRRLPEQRRCTIAIAVLVICALIHCVYVVRVGGDFMHGRMMLLPLFALLLPVSVVPVWAVRAQEGAESRRRILGYEHGVLCAGGIAGAVWGLSVIMNGHAWTVPEDDSHLSIVDERVFWLSFTSSTPDDPMLLATDFLRAVRMEDYQWALAASTSHEPDLYPFSERGAGSILPIMKTEDTYSWICVPRFDASVTSDLNNLAPTVTYLNLGMTAMNAPLDVRVLDTVGLTTPIAARQPRIADGRIGHDKQLDITWQLADSASDGAVLPAHADPQVTADARHALYTKDFVRLFRSYRAPMNAKRFFANIKYALTEGRTLTLSDDPADYLDEPTYGDGEGPYVIAWPTSVAVDTPR